MKYKRWSLSEKLEIIGIVETCRKYSISTGTFYSWRTKFGHKGENGLKVTNDNKSKEFKQVEEENRVQSSFHKLKHCSINR